MCIFGILHRYILSIIEHPSWFCYFCSSAQVTQEDPQLTGQSAGFSPPSPSSGNIEAEFPNKEFVENLNKLHGHNKTYPGGQSDELLKVFPSQTAWGGDFNSPWHLMILQEGWFHWECFLPKSFVIYSQDREICSDHNQLLPCVNCGYTSLFI